MTTAILKTEVQTRLDAITYSAGTLQAVEVLQLAVDAVGLDLDLINIISVHNSLSSAITSGTSEDDLTAINSASLILGVTSKGGGLDLAPVITVPNTTGELLKAGTEIYLEQLTHKYFKKSVVINEATPRVEANLYTNKESASIRTDDGNVFSFSLRTTIGSSYNSIQLYQYKNSAEDATVTTATGASPTFNGADTYNSKYIGIPYRVASDTWVAILQQGASDRPRLVKFVYDSVTQTMTPIVNTTSYTGANYSTLSYTEIVPTWDGHFWLFSRDNSSNLVGYKVIIATMDYTESDLSCLTGTITSRVATDDKHNPAFAFSTSDGNIAFIVNSTIELKEFTTSFVDVGTVTGETIADITTTCVVKVATDKWLFVKATPTTGLYEQQAVVYDPNTTTITISEQLQKTYNQDTTPFYVGSGTSAVVINNTIYFQAPVNVAEFLTVKINPDTLELPEEKDIKIYPFYYSSNGSFSLKGGSIVDGFYTGFISMGSTSNTYNSLIMPLAFPIGTLLPNRAPIRVGYLKSDSTTTELEIVINSTHSISDELVVGELYGNDVAISNTILLYNQGSIPPQQRVTMIENNIFVNTSDEFRSTFGDEYMYCVFGERESATLQTIIGETYDGSFGIKANSTSQEQVPCLLLLDGIPFGNHFATQYSGTSTASGALTFEYSGAKSMSYHQTVSLSGKVVHVYAKEGKIS